MHIFVSDVLKHINYVMSQMVQQNKQLKRQSQLLISQVGSLGEINLVSFQYYYCIHSK